MSFSYFAVHDCFNSFPPLHFLDICFNVHWTHIFLIILKQNIISDNILTSCNLIHKNNHSNNILLRLKTGDHSLLSCHNHLQTMINREKKYLFRFCINITYKSGSTDKTETLMCKLKGSFIIPFLVWLEDSNPTILKKNLNLHYKYPK